MKDRNRSIVAPGSSLLGRLKLNWHPQPIAKPLITVQFDQLDHLQRTAEVFHYSLRRLEWWISPNGTLREWLRFNLMVAAVLGIPALLIVPLITYLLEQFTSWTAQLTRIASNLIVFPTTILIGIALFSAVAVLIRRLLRR